MSTVHNIIQLITDKGIPITIIESTTQYAARIQIKKRWKELKDGDCLIITGTNPKTYEQSTENDVFKTIHQIDGPPKFTLKDDHGVTVIRKTGPLVMSDGVIEWDGFVMFREAILHLVTWDEAIKIIDGWD